jgi:trans-aconitate 2-methyltransferase
MSDWDARTYHRLAAPQLAWGRRVAQRLAACPGERILDIGCGTGRLTAELTRQAGDSGRTVGLDVSHAMLEQARQASPGIGFVRADGAALPFAASTFDAVFSSATFHWIADHARLFREVHTVLKPGGRLIAQCGGGPNLQRLLERAHALMSSADYAPFFGKWRDPWVFAGVADTRARLQAARFIDIEVSLEPAPTTLEDAAAFADFISCVCVRHHVDRLPADRRRTFVGMLTQEAAKDDPPFTLDYWRLNVAARKGSPEGLRYE